MAGATRVRRSPRRRRPIVILIAGCLLGLMAVAYLVAHFMATDTVPRNASVNQVPIGGLSAAEATTRLAAELAPTDEAAFNLTGQPGQQVEIAPAAAGLSVDYAATVRQAGAGASWDPRVLLRVLTGGGPTAPVVVVDQQRLSASIAAQTAEFTRDPEDAKLTLAGTTVHHESMLLGTALNIEGTTRAVAEAYRQAARRPVEQPRTPFTVAAALTTSEPAITDVAVDPVADRLRSALQPITVKTQSAQAELSAERIAAATTLTPAQQTIAMTVDYQKLYDISPEVIDPLTIIKPVDATVRLQDSRPVVVPAVGGQSISKDAFAAAVAAVLAEPTPRAIELEVTSVPAAFSTEQAEALGIKEVVGEFTTYFPPSSYHNTNLGLAAAGINNTLIKPGQVFSLAQATGPRNASTGYVAGGVLVGDRIEMIVGGGVSQSATTTYNAAFFAGMTDIEHHPHTQYFSQYPPGREATVYEGVLDLQFRNDTPYGVLMEAYVVPSGPGRGSITVRVWSSKYFDSVTASEPVLSNYTSGRDIVKTSPGCIPQSAASGFDVNFQRILVREGHTTTEDYFWRYSPVDRIICRQPDPPADTAGETPG